MRKLPLLREAILASTTAPRIEPDQLFTFLRNGSVVDTGAGLRYEATAIVIVIDWMSSADPITHALVQWLRTRENATQGALQFEVDVIDHGKVDLRYELPFTEIVVFDGNESEACAAQVPDPELLPLR